MDEYPEAIFLVLGDVAALCGAFNKNCIRCKSVAIVAKIYGIPLKNLYEEFDDEEE